MWKGSFKFRIIYDTDLFEIGSDDNDNGINTSILLKSIVTAQ